MKGPYQFRGASLVHTVSGKVVGQAGETALTIYNPKGEAASCAATKREAMAALRKLQARLNSKALLDAMGIY